MEFWYPCRECNGGSDVNGTKILKVQFSYSKDIG